MNGCNRKKYLCSPHGTPGIWLQDIPSTMPTFDFQVPRNKSPKGIIPVATSQEKRRPQTNCKDSRSAKSDIPLFCTKSSTAREVIVNDSYKRARVMSFNVDFHPTMNYEFFW